MANLGDRLYESFQSAETGGEANPWIRTRISPPEGSSAYGPVQITKTLAKDFLDNLKHLFTTEEKNYLRRFIRQGNLFLRFGNEPNKQGYDPRYDYGGEGDLTSNEDKRLYEQVAKKMLVHMFSENTGNIESTIKEWRFGAASNKGRNDDQRYFAEVEDVFNTYAVQAPQTPSETPSPTPTPTPSEEQNVQQEAFTAREEAIIANIIASRNRGRGRRRFERAYNEARLAEEASESQGLGEEALIDKLSRRPIKYQVVEERVFNRPIPKIERENQEIDWYDDRIRNQLF